MLSAGYPVSALMEKAGLKLTELFTTLFPLGTHSKVGIIIGSGHNSGDALVMARELLAFGYAVTVLDCAHKKKKELTQSYFNYFKSIGGKVTDLLASANRRNHIYGAKFDVLIDGLYGFGFRAPMETAHAHLIAAINKLRKPVFAIDLPSGLDANLGTGNAIVATHTACLGAFKAGLFQTTALKYVGTLHFIDLGFTSTFLPKQSPYTTTVLTAATLHAFFSKELQTLYKKNKDVNKYTNSVAIGLVGSPQFPGAGLLSLNAILATGVGYLYALHSSSLFTKLLNKQPSLVPFKAEDAENILRKQKRSISILCGSGVPGSSDLPLRVLQQVKKLRTNVICVWDAGAFAMLRTQFPLAEKKKQAVHILTPHLGEFQLLFPLISEKLNNRFITQEEAAYLAAVQSKAIIVLKGAHTVIADPQGVVWVNWHSTQALAKAGTGDVLAGIIAGLCAHGVQAFVSACVAVFIHSQIALEIENKKGFFTVTPEQLVQNISSFLFKFSQSSPA